MLQNYIKEKKGKELSKMKERLIIGGNRDICGRCGSRHGAMTIVVQCMVVSVVVVANPLASRVNGGVFT